jgi:arsenite methyltransferase
MSETSIKIDERYSNLAEKSCCLSCGGAINHAATLAGETVVDLGSGRGNDVIRLAEIVGKKGFVYGIDISEGMLTKARKNAKKFGITNCEFKFSTIEKLPLEDCSVNLFISNCTINHAQDKTAVWNEVYRVLKPGGRFVVSDIYSSEPVPEKWATDPEAIAECWAGAVVKDLYIDTLIGAGFSDLTILEESEPYPKGVIECSSLTIRGYKPS